MEKTRLLLISDIHYCQEEYGEISRDEKAQLLLDLIHKEYEKDPFAMILFLGDYSLDHWGWYTKGTWLTEGVSYTKRFVEKYCGQLPTPYYMLPGNHEQFGQQMWQQLTGFSRSAEYVIGDYLFLLWDSFGADLDPTEHSDGTYTPPDTAQLLSAMDRHPGKRVILCSHSFQPCSAPEEQTLIRDDRVVCLFQGHSHHSGIIMLPKEYGSKYLIHCGGWGSTSPASNLPWGVRELYLETDRLSTGYIVPEAQLLHKGNRYTVSPRRQNTLELSLDVLK